MQAIVRREYGSAQVLELTDADRPVPEDDQVLVRVRASSVNPYDWHAMTGLPQFMRLMTGLRRPKVAALGADLAGVVEEVGPAVHDLRPGDEVFGEVEEGAFAEYVGAAADVVAPKPAGLTFEQAAAVPMAGVTALQALRDHGRVRPGHAVLVNGASGGVGTFAVQLARHLGAEVTGVCSTRNVELVRSLGAAEVVDYTRDDFTRGGPRYDVILDLIGNRSTRECRRVLAPKGVYIASFGQPEHRVLGPLGRLAGMLVVSPFVGHTLTTFVSKPNRPDLVLLADLLERDEVTPVIDRTVALGDLADAMAHVAAGHARGKVVVTI
ncbi:MAG: NAD(P)-dependent alcohol dehydrogenase [Acidimicrobiales bacterium]